MRNILILLVLISTVACQNSATKRNQPDTAAAVLTANSGQPTTQADSTVQFLLAASAADFNSHGPHPTAFRHVYVGHMQGDGNKQVYLLSGMFITAAQTNTSKSTAFCTIKTSGYEQYLGAQATTFMQQQSVQWDTANDLSAALQSRLNERR